MAENMDIVRLAIDTYKGTVKNFSVDESLETLRKALVDVNNGKNYLDYRDIRDGKCAGLFSILETIISRTSNEGFKGDEFFNTLVEYRNVGEGDQPEFTVEDTDLFIVSRVANGTQSLRRQRLVGSETFTVPTTMRAVKVYESINRLLSGRSDMNTFIRKISESFTQQKYNDIYTAFAAATVADYGGNAYFPAAGSYDADTTLDVISHVEAAAGGKSAKIIVTKKTARTLAPDIQGSDSKNDLYNLGYYGKFYGTPVIVVPNRHKIGSTEFVLPDNEINIIAGDDKPIKFVTEGNGLIIPTNATDNADLTQEYLYGEKYGIGFTLAAGNTGIGKVLLSD